MEGKQQHSWRGRTDSLYFRGAKTGQRSHLEADQEFMNSSDIDVRFSGWTGDKSHPFSSLPEHCNYRWASSLCFHLTLA